MIQAVSQTAASRKCGSKKKAAGDLKGTKLAEAAINHRLYDRANFIDLANTNPLPPNLMASRHRQLSCGAAKYDRDQPDFETSVLLNCVFNSLCDLWRDAPIQWAGKNIVRRRFADHVS